MQLLAKILFVSVLCIYMQAAQANYSCVNAQGNTYILSQRSWEDTCTNLATGEVLPPQNPLSTLPPKPTPADARPLQKELSKPRPFKSNPADARYAMNSGKKAVLNALKDPDSAKFRGLFTVIDVYLCGEVNAKNSMGGYTGFTRFIAMSGMSGVDFDDDSRTFQEQWAMDCGRMTRGDIDYIRGR